VTSLAFIQKWKAATLTERAAAQSYFNDLCALLGVDPPASADPSGAWFAFEKGAKKVGGGEGWADIWRKGCFAWEMKGKHKDLNAALAQLQRYAPALDNPPLLIVSDMDRIEIHANFTNAIHTVETLSLAQLAIPEKLHRLKQAFIDPEYFRPSLTRIKVTEKAAAEFAELAQRLRDRGLDPHRVARFNTKLLFCLFAEDIGLLPNKLFSKVVDTACRKPGTFEKMARQLFDAMRTGGEAAFEPIDHFNGGLFEDNDVIPLNPADLQHLRDVAKLSWEEIEPSIFGTLFERGLDPGKRSQLGAHYTDRDSIERILRPVVFDLLDAEWSVVKTEISNAKSPKKRRLLFDDFLVRLRDFRVLDPACGSGNFLYIALIGIRDFELRVLADAEALDLGGYLSYATGPQNVMGIELNPYAAELARLTVWIGDIQWSMKHHGGTRNPILSSLETIECRDAILNPDGSEPTWSPADCIVGNPPFLGDKRMLEGLGQDYTNRLRSLYADRISGGVDLVTYWFEKARAQLQAGLTKRIGLVATNSIRKGRSRVVLDALGAKSHIFNAWSDLPWVVDGADVRVSIVCASKQPPPQAFLDGKPVAAIHPDLTAGFDATLAAPLPENKGRCYFGLCLAGQFAVSGTQAREWLVLPNTHGLSNAEVLRPIYNGRDLTDRFRDRWVIDFGTDLSEAQASLFEAPFKYVSENVKPVRTENKRSSRANRWWLHGETRPGLRKKLIGLSRFIATSETAKHRVFQWLPASIAPEHKLVVFPTDDDLIMGILSSRFHANWATLQGNRLGVGNDPVYNTERCFETFPFPKPTAEQRTAISDAARALTNQRDRWLNPPEWIALIPESDDRYPARQVPRSDDAAHRLKSRTLTNLYNDPPQWLSLALQKLNNAVAEAYGWAVNIPNEEAMAALLELNQGLAKPELPS